MNRPIAIATAFVLDRVIPEPPNATHPVAWFGTAMTKLESVLWRDDRRRGVLYTAIGVGGTAVVTARARSLSSVLSTVIAGTALRRTAAAIASDLERGDLGAARTALPSLVGRDPSGLDASDISAAVIESVAENMVDAVIAPTFWAIVAGPQGAAVYRAINTMDAMVGHRSERYERFGWAAAKLDDVANYVPARLFAGLVAVQHRADWRAIVATIRRDAPAHPSPNAGVAETAMAAAIGRELGGPLMYGTRREERPRLGDGPRPMPNDIATANQIAERTEWIIAGACTAVGALMAARRLTRLSRG